MPRRWRRLLGGVHESRPNSYDSPVAARFRCKLCGAAAGSVLLAKPGEPTPIPDHITGVPPGTEWIGSEWARVVVPEFGSIVLMGDDGGVKAEAYEVAIRNQSESDLYQLSPDAVPLWCPNCCESYCRGHWDSDRHSTPDNLYGRCPSGHLRRLWGD